MLNQQNNHDIYNLHTVKSADVKSQIDRIQSVLSPLNSTQRNTFSDNCIANQGWYGTITGYTGRSGLSNQEYTACNDLKEVASKEGLDGASSESTKVEKFNKFIKDSVSGYTNIHGEQPTTEKANSEQPTNEKVNSEKPTSEASQEPGYLRSAYDSVIGKLQKLNISSESLDEARKSKILEDSRSLKQTLNPKDGKLSDEVTKIKEEFQKDNFKLADQLILEAKKLKTGKSDVFVTSSRIGGTLQNSVKDACVNLKSSKDTSHVCNDTNRIFEKPTTMGYISSMLFTLTCGALAIFGIYKFAKYSYNSITNPDRDWSNYNPWTNIKSFFSHPWESTKNQCSNLKDGIKSGCTACKNKVVKVYNCVVGNEEDKKVEEKKKEDKKVEEKKKEDKKAEAKKEETKKEEEKAKDQKEAKTKNVKTKNDQDTSESNSKGEKDKKSKAKDQTNSNKHKPKKTHGGVTVDDYPSNLVDLLGSNSKLYIENAQKEGKTWHDVFSDGSMNQMKQITDAVEAYKLGGIDQIKKIINAQRFGMDINNSMPQSLDDANDSQNQTNNTSTAEQTTDANADGDADAAELADAK